MGLSSQIEEQLSRWVGAGVLDRESAERIRAYESAQGSPRMRWPTIFAVAFGAIMVAAGVLLFVAAHWDYLSPGERLLLVLATIAGFHIAAGLLMPRMSALGMALHAIGTVSLGGGIFLTAQSFNLQEHWPNGILLWAIGAVLTWLVLRDWVQGTIAALLVPVWISCEWSVRMKHFVGAEELLVQFLAMLAIAYFSARTAQDDSYFRRALVWVGGIGVLPLCAFVAASHEEWVPAPRKYMSFSGHGAAFVCAFVSPLLIAYVLRRRLAVWNASYALWVYVVGLLNPHEVFQSLTVYALCALGSIGLVAWGLREHRNERINLGVAGFALTIAVFYFSSVMDKMGRSASLVAFGLIFLLGGWKLEQLRRGLIARAGGHAG